MFCSNCGAKIPDEASFCWKCGKPQKQNTIAEAEEPKWETCEVDWQAPNIGFIDAFLGGVFLKQSGYFAAKAIGPKGVYVAGKTQAFSSSPAGPYPNDNRANQILNELVAQLVKDGWEPVETKGKSWYSHRFRRRSRN